MVQPFEAAAALPGGVAPRSRHPTPDNPTTPAGDNQEILVILQRELPTSRYSAFAESNDSINRRKPSIQIIVIACSRDQLKNFGMSSAASAAVIPV